MAGHQPIRPFPAEIDRDRFADWLSGFCDGEACFMLVWDNRKHRQTGTAWFTICLRQDDRPILEQIQAFLGCGRLFDEETYQKTVNGKPESRLIVAKARDLVKSVIPHFERYPLRAKKAKDFAIWRRGVDLLDRIVRKGKVRRAGGRTGFASNWSDQDKALFQSLVQALRDVRRFDATPAALPERPANGDTDHQGLMFEP
jgi:hypothetical protein